MSTLHGTEGMALRISELQQEVTKLREMVADLHRINYQRDKRLAQLEQDVNRALALGGEPK